MAWKTYLVLFFGTTGAKPSEVVAKIESLGFKSTLGPVDFIYEWGNKEPLKTQVLELANQLAKNLIGTSCIFNIDTHN
jgi:hypothetical protein